FVAAVSRDEDDRWDFRLATLTNECGGLESIHAGHAHVEHDHGEVLGHDAAQRRKPGVGFYDRIAERRQYSGQRQPLRRIVVDQQDWDTRVDLPLRSVDASDVFERHRGRQAIDWV